MRDHAHGVHYQNFIEKVDRLGSKGGARVVSDAEETPPKAVGYACSVI